jgi:hypothetical protein
MVLNPLEGCILAPSSAPWQGLKKIHQLGGNGQELIIPELPGFFTIESPRYKDQEGWFIPENLVQMGRRPGLLGGYQPEAHDRTPSGLLLDDHQLRAVTFFRQVDDQWGGALLGADAGTGKTIVACHALWLDGFLHQKGIVVGPNPARSAWVGEQSDPSKHYQLNIIPLEGQTPDHRVFEQGNWFFIHYDILPNWYSCIFNQFRPDVQIFDESHYLANPNTRRSKDCRQLSKAAFTKRRLLLTGTPIPKYRMDLWAQLAVAQPNQWGENRHHYGVRYCAGRRETVGDAGSYTDAHWVYDGQSNTDELRARACGVYLRFTKDEIADKLPELKRETIILDRDMIDLTNYWDAQLSVGKYSKEEETKQYIEVAGRQLPIPKTEDKKTAKHLTSITALICELEMAKLPAAIKELCVLTGQIDKLVVFVHQRKAATALVQKLRSLSQPGYPAEWIVGPITGEINQKKREQVARKFAGLKKGVAVCTRASMGVAINELATAEVGIQVCPDWNPSGNLQCESRWHRKGNPHPLVRSIYFRVPGTIDDLFMEKLDAKAQESAAISKVDTAGTNLVADLTPQGTAGKGDDLDDICAILADMEDE